MVYQWKQSRFPVEAQKAGEELERIKNKYGGIVPKTVVDESRTEDAILHECFDWNDATAAEAYREVQAREIVRCIVITKTTDEKQQEEITVRAFVPVYMDDNKSKKYISIEDALSDSNYEKQIIEQAKNEMIALKSKFGKLMQFAELVKKYLLDG